MRLIKTGFVGLGLLALAACSSMEERSGPVPSQFPIQGIDVSKYQGVIDWQTAAKSGVRFAYIKATEGGDRADDLFQANWEGARAAGIPDRRLSFLLFLRPVEEQAAWFKTHVPPAPDALPPVLDMEWNPQSPTCKLRPPADKIKADMRIFLADMESFYGKRPIIYTTVDFHRDVLPNDMHEYPYWLRSVAGHPQLKYGNRKWAFWQYTATGTVPGVGGKVDRNAFVGSEKEWQAFLSQGSMTGSITARADVTQ